MRLVAVFRDQDTARKAAAQVEASAGERIRVRVGAREDEIDSLKGEMREEMSAAVIGPGNVGPFTREQTRGLLAGTIVYGLLGLLLGTPLGFIPLTGVSLSTRLVSAALIGLITGATIGFTAGGGFSGRRRTEGDMAAERGVIVSAQTDDADLLDEVAIRFNQLDPIRVDIVRSDGVPLGEVTNEERSHNENRRHAS